MLVMAGSTIRLRPHASFQLLLLSPLLSVLRASKADAFLQLRSNSADLTPHELVPGITSRSSARPQQRRQCRAAIPSGSASSKVTAEEWNGLEEDDHVKFLEGFWQKRPLLIRGAFPGFKTLLSKDELAGLACCPDVESRVITGGQAGISGGHDWELAHGPFEEKVFSELGESYWTLLVNEVNRHIPEVSDLLQNFRFVPSWRIDDVMISYAPEGGSVGPHVDNNDVFLLQGAGKRRWSIENEITTGVDEQSRSIPDIDVRVLSDFRESQAWVLEPGDALYLPPRIAHHGVSMDSECMTYSVGFRAPSTRDLVSFFGDHVANSVAKTDAFYVDHDLRKQDNHGLISKDAVMRAKGMIREALLSALDDESDFDRWFGSHVTRSRRDHTGYPLPMDEEEGLSFGYQTPEDVTSALLRTFRKHQASGTSDDATGPFVYHAEGLTFAFTEHGEQEGGATLFVDGDVYPLRPSLSFAAALICKSPRLSHKQLGPALDGQHGEGVADLLHALLREGYLYPADD